MRKLKLSVENLQVESFDPEAAPMDQEGTVHGRETVEPMSCWPACSDDTYCAASRCNTNQATCPTCIEEQYASQCGGHSCYDVC
jgi:hypothetical protein